MAHKWAIDAVDRLLRDIHGCHLPFGGRTVLFAGDMQQLLPVHRFAKDPAAYCFKAVSEALIMHFRFSYFALH